jgi:hypothetical protein
VRGLVLWLVAVAAGCSAPVIPAGVVPSASALRVEVAGCRDVREGPGCELEGRTPLTVFVAAPVQSAVRVRSGTTSWPAVWSTEDGGWRARGTPSTTALVLFVELGSQSLRWELVHTTRASELVGAEALARAGEVPRARRWLTRLSTSAAPRLAGEASSALARMSAAEGDLGAAQRHWLAAADLASRAGRRGRAANERMSAAYVALQHSRDLAAARALLSQVEAELPADDAAGRASLEFYRGTVAAQLGDTQAALVALARASATAARLELARVRLAVDHKRSQVLATVGLYAEALALLAPLDVAAADRPCERAWVGVARTWVGLLSVEAGGPLPPALPGQAEDTLTRLRAHCADPAAEANMHLNLALVELARGASTTARAHLAAARRLGADQLVEQHLWRLDLEGRVALAVGSATTAEARFAELDRAAEAAGSGSARWRAKVGAAAALRAGGRLEAARAAYAESRQLLRAESLQVDVGGGRTQFLASRRRADQAEVALALEVGERARAVALMRASRAEGLHTVTQPLRVSALPPGVRARWDEALARYGQAVAGLEALASHDWGQAAPRAADRLSQRRALEAQRIEALEDALVVAGSSSPPAPRPADPDELIVGYFARRGTGADPQDLWLGFIQDARGTEVVELGPLDLSAGPEALASTLLGPFDARLSRVRRVRVLSEGLSQHVDVHALPWRGRPLVAHAVVVYGLDAGTSTRAAAGLGAAVVGDPLGDLPSARDEASEVAVQLRQLGAEVEVLSGVAASRARLERLLDRVDHLHYAGHGRFDGALGLDSHLPLSGGTVLSVGDVLLRARVPRRLVLSSCDSARTASLGGVQLGLAQAFVLAGAHEVVAATRPVPDALARRLAAALYARSEEPLALSLQRAQLALLHESPREDWAAFRVYVP